jgi:YidC/Oxa1 family membrane protein insertase
LALPTDFMDRKSIIILVVSFILLLLWYPLVVNKLYPPKPLPPGSTNSAAATNFLATNQGPISVPQVNAGPTPVPQAVANTNVPEQSLQVSNENARYTFTSHGGGLKQIELLKHRENVATRRKQPDANRVKLNTYTPAPTLALLDGDAIQGDGIFTLTQIPDGVRAEKTLTNGLSIVKEFHLSSNYLVTATVRLENQSTQQLVLPPQEWIVGTASPMGAGDNLQTVGVLWYNGNKTEDIGTAFFSPHGFACVPRVPPAEYRGGASNVVWVTAHNQFFALAAMPQQPAQAVVIRKLTLPRLTGEEATLVATNAPAPEGYEAAMVYPEVKLPPNGRLERQVFLYAGPKEYQTLARIGDQLNNNLDLVMNFGWFGFFSKALLLGMNWLHHSIKLPYGWAIIAITVIIKLVFWPLTQASTRSMKRMQALQPQMNALKEKYKDDPVKAQRKTMELWKEHKVSPVGGCLPMVLQIPVFFGFYRMIQSAIELRGAPFLWVKDLARPDTLAIISGMGWVPFIGVPGVGLPFNLLPLVMGVTMLWQARLTPPSPGMDPMQAKIMRYMPLMFMVFLYNFSAGLTLYWTVQNLLTIAQTKLTRAKEPLAVAAPKAPVLTPAQKKRK